MSNGQLAFLGGGNMGRALIGGLLRRGTRPEHISVGESFAAARQSLAADFGIQATDNNAAAVEKASVIVLAVKPQIAGEVLTPLKPLLQRTRPLVISIAAGIRVTALEGWCGAGVPVVRSMPNRPALVGAGATGLYAPPSVPNAQRGIAEKVMQAVGEVVWVTDVPHACLGNPPDAVGRMTLAHGKKCDGVDISAGRARGRFNAIADESYLRRRILRNH